MPHSKVLHGFDGISPTKKKYYQFIVLQCSIFFHIQCNSDFLVSSYNISVPAASHLKAVSDFRRPSVVSTSAQPAVHSFPFWWIATWQDMLFISSPDNLSVAELQLGSMQFCQSRRRKGIDLLRQAQPVMNFNNSLTMIDGQQVKI